MEEFLPKVVCVKVADIRPEYENLKQWIEDSSNEYIGRGGIVFIDGKRFPPKNSILANPFKSDDNTSIEDVLSKYQYYLRDQVDSGKISSEYLKSLANKKRLGCWCKSKNHPDVPCHGDIVIEFIKEAIKKS